jgi:hypothetical protein
MLRGQCAHDVAVIARHHSPARQVGGLGRYFMISRSHSSGSSDGLAVAAAFARGSSAVCADDIAGGSSAACADDIAGGSSAACADDSDECVRRSLSRL